MIRIFVIILSSLLLLSCSTAPVRLDGPQAGSIPLVSFVLDDGNDTDYLLGRRIFAEQGAVACSAVTTDRIGTPYHLTQEQIRGLQQAGWEIMGHTVTHPNLNSLSEDELDDELLKSKMILENLGVTVNNIVYPYNKNNSLVRSVARKYYRSGRGGTNSLNTGVDDPYFLKSYTLKHDLQLMQSHIDRAYAEKSWLIFYSHEIDAKVKVSDIEGDFIKGEDVTLTGSGTVGRYTTRHWFPVYGSYMYIVPFSGVPREGDIITGVRSGATARIDYIMYNDLTLLSDMLRYIRSTYPDMRIVTIDQGLDLLGIPAFQPFSKRNSTGKAEGTP